ncbi:hypothetical protein ACFOET_05095 [Parapedobacter deserti]|uniref:Uncharacterized protein n=1 Tax=Parapedobacter deserti TaxID=1912957 RepID=A0ABV7JLR2_9SPHI
MEFKHPVSPLPKGFIAEKRQLYAETIQMIIVTGEVLPFFPEMKLRALNDFDSQTGKTSGAQWTEFFHGSRKDGFIERSGDTVL